MDDIFKKLENEIIRKIDGYYQSLTNHAEQENKLRIDIDKIEKKKLASRKLITEANIELGKLRDYMNSGQKGEQAVTNTYPEIPDHEEIETKPFQENVDDMKEMRDQVDTYSKMLELIGQHMDEYANSGLVNEYITLINIQSVFDDFRNK